MAEAEAAELHAAAQEGRVLDLNAALCAKNAAGTPATPPHSHHGMIPPPALIPRIVSAPT